MSKRKQTQRGTKTTPRGGVASTAFQPFDVRWQNFRSLHDTGWLPLKRLTVLIGPNGTGKTSVIAPLLLLKQSLQSADKEQALRTRGPFFDAGSFDELISDKESNRDLIFGIRFHSHIPEKGEKLSPPPNYPPGEVEVSFDRSPEDGSPRLKTFTVRDIYGQQMLRRTRMDSGRFTLDAPWFEGSSSHLRDIAVDSRPDRFLFTGDAEVQSLLAKGEPEHLENRKGTRELRIKARLTIEPTEQAYLSTLGVAARFMRNTLLNRVSFIGPLRRHAERLYELSGEHPLSVGTSGEFAPEILYRGKNPEVLRSVNDWVKKFGFGFELKCQIIGPDAFSLMAKRPDGVLLNVADTGFGLSQVLPLIVQLVSSGTPILLIAEQPEIHLNPRLQSRLADLFIEATRRGHAVLVETHSEHLLLRLRRLIAEGEISADEVSLLYAESIEHISEVRPIKIRPNGELEGWPRGFFEESLGESLALATAQASWKE